MSILHRTQAEVAKDKHRFRVLCCGRRWGKTTEACEEIKGCALYKNARIAYIAPTYQQARDIAWEQIKKELEPIIKEANESRLELRVKNKKDGESIVFLRGWESIEGLRGQKFDLLILDEVAMMRNFWTNWREILRPTLIDTNGEAMFISTPKGFNHFYELYNFESKDLDYRSYHFTTYDNPFIPVDEIEKAKLELTEDAFAQEFLADFRKTEGLVYKEFDRTKHIYDTERIPNPIETIAGVDFGFTNPCTVLHITKDYDNSYWIEKEWYYTNKTEDEISEYVAANKFAKVYPDPESPSAIELMRKKGVNIREVIKNKDSIKVGIEKIRELLKQGKLHIHKSCENLIWEFETYSYADKKDQRNQDENPIKENDHCFVANTFITMANGKRKRLKDIKIGELVKTQHGINKVLLSRLTRKKENVVKVDFSDGSSLIGTGEHKIYTKRGNVALDALRYNDIIETLNSHNLSLWKKQSSLIIKDILGTVNTIRQLADIRTEEKDYIKLYGKTLTELSQKVFISTIKTTTNRITKSLILNLSKLKSIYQNTLKTTGKKKNLEKKLENIVRILDLLQSYGTLQIKGLNGINNTVKIVGKVGKQYQKLVTSVEKNIKLFSPQEVDFAITIVKRKHYGKEDVYSLTVKNEHNYYANGILVKNCLDALRYAIMMQSNTKNESQHFIPSGIARIPQQSVKQFIPKYGRY